MCNTFSRSYSSHIPIPHLTVSAAQRECVRPSFGFPMYEFRYIHF